MNIIERQIIDSLDEAAKAISLAFSNGDKTVINKHYFNIKKAFSKTKIHVTNDYIPFDDDIEKIFSTKILNSAKDIDNKYKTTIVKNINLIMEGKYTPSTSNIHIQDEEFHSLYLKNKRLFDGCLIDEIQVYNVYKTNKKLLNSLVIELNSFSHEVDKIQETIKNGVKELKNLSPLLDAMAKTHNLCTYHDILNFYNQLNSLILDTSLLDENMQQTIESYKKQALEKESIKQLSKSEIKTLINNTKLLLNNSLFKTLLTNSHINEFCNSLQIPLSIEYIKSLISTLKVLNSNQDYGAATTLIKDTVVCIFRQSIPDYYKIKNSTITHELIHAYTLNNNNLVQLEIIESKYKLLDEFITEFLSRKSQKYLLDDIITVKPNRKINSSLGYPDFDFIIKELDNTPLMNTLIDIKVNNDIDNIEKRVGKETLSLLTSYLDDPLNMNKYNKLMNTINKKK